MQLLIYIFLNKLGVTPLIFACPAAFYGILSSSFAKNACMKEKNIDIMYAFGRNVQITEAAIIDWF